MNRIAGRRLPALQFALLLSLVALAAARPPTEDDSDLTLLPPDADNVEIHQVEFVNGVMQEDHPVIMYKEDFVTEDFDPSKNGSSPGHHKKHRRAHHHHAEPRPENEGEKILFDVLPDKPIVLKDDLEAAPVSHLEATQLATPVKEEWLRKLPKKFHSRQRRSAYAQWNSLNGQYSGYPYGSNLPLTTLYYFPRLAVAGKKPTLQGASTNWPTNRVRDQDIPVPDDIGTRLDLIHNSNPEDADFSQFDRPRPTRPSNSGGSGGGRGGANGRPIFSTPAPERGSGQGFGGNGIPTADDLVAQAYPLSSFTPPASAPQASAPRPSFRQDTLQFPQEQEQQADSKCQRASKYCCGLRNIASLYDCYQKQGCNDSLSDIISGCS